MRWPFIHVQYEMLHPFLDGSGRLGRVLIPLLMRHSDARSCFRDAVHIGLWPRSSLATAPGLTHTGAAAEGRYAPSP